MTSYLTQGFKGLSIAMDQPFTSTFGLGFSEFFRHNILKFTGHAQDEPADVASTYAGKITGAGWPVGQRWATFFIHPASDVGFPGVVLLMVLIGWAFGAAWRDVVMFGDPLATSVFISLCLLVFYLSANNQLFQGGERAIGFSVLLVAWLAMRRRWRWSMTSGIRPLAMLANGRWITVCASMDDGSTTIFMRCASSSTSSNAMRHTGD